MARINAEFNKWLQNADAGEKLLGQGAEAAGGSPEQFATYIRKETEKCAKVVRASGAKVD